ncbi:COMM domain-containing protein 7 isoform X1 [Homo sapiens]|uniref:COMM domain-containing protein 7 isoform X1 n=1 Tax=Homo sapiens TaxID=9606 RepID=UPI000056F130|nr:COMM domain-containing protein 7 isoform X1 [Homo sapiens]XP_054179055.1 COMM domain-containing protein 7 isoform X1 [Homo sapiens]|eukprot:XP_005260356.1 COMM domain-containing protein 7 isoform X1 [Homo sapiens]
MGRLHCTEDPVPEAVGGDMQQLNQLGAQQFSALTEVLFHFLTEPKEVERFLAQLSEFATTNQISLGSLRSIVKSLLLVPNGALKKSLTAKQVQADFITLGLSEEKATYFSEKWKQNAPTLARWAIGQTLMINQLIDMEWKFGVTSGSSELEKVGSIFLQLKLVVKKGNQTENVYIGESEFPLEPLHLFCVLCNQGLVTLTTNHVFYKNSHCQLWSSCSTAFPLLKDGTRSVRKPLAGWSPHS